MTSATGASSSWILEGDYFEGCDCNVSCPCVLFKGDPDEGHCNATAAWHIQNGSYDNTDVGGLNVVGVFHTPGNMLTGPKWKVALYIDEKATEEQSAPIEFGIDGRRRWLHIKDSMELEIEGVTGGDGNQESRLVNPAFSVVPGSDLVIARSTKYRYDDHGMKWDNSGRNGFYCKFRYSS
jgi:hypothetical protein